MDEKLVNFLRVTSALEINGANSGHTGVCLGGAPAIYAIYKNMNVYGKEDKWINRDRFVLSCGHASALLYATLHLFGFNVTVDDLKSFRQLGSITPGHPEYNLTDGVDATTGPLGQGIGMAVGMALAESILHETFAHGELSPIDHFTYCMCGDGCLMEGVALEAISFAGRNKLNKLILLYDENDITIEGDRDLANDESVKMKFTACHWNVIDVKDGSNVALLEEAIRRAKLSDKPSVIISHTKIGHGSSLEGTNTIHGKALTPEQIAELRQNLGFFEEDYNLPADCQEYMLKLLAEKERAYKNYEEMCQEYRRKFPKDYNKFVNLDHNFDVDMSSFIKGTDGEFDFRKLGHDLLNKVAKGAPNFVGGSADLTPSTKMILDGVPFYSAKTRAGTNLAFGIREHAMGAICNGIALHGGLRPFCSTFFSFENYLTPALRLSCLMRVPVLYYFTHDSVSVGEDGPTHQPIEQLATLRAMPNLHTFRPCGESELCAMYDFYFKNNLPVVNLIPRQPLQTVKDSFFGASHGGYVLSDEKDFDYTIIATGSEVQAVIKAKEILSQSGHKVRVVSMPCVELFLEQDGKYKSRVLDNSKPIFAVEMSSDSTWYQFVNNTNNLANIKTFGVSGALNDVISHFGFDGQGIANKIKALYEK